jgi:hypothetical protein
LEKGESEGLFPFEKIKKHDQEERVGREEKQSHEGRLSILD